MLDCYLRSFYREVSLSCHTQRDKGPFFLLSHKYEKQCTLITWMASRGTVMYTRVPEYGRIKPWQTLDRGRRPSDTVFQGISLVRDNSYPGSHGISVSSLFFLNESCKLHFIEKVIWWAPFFTSEDVFNQGCLF